ncbi:hypothetical protein JKP23_17225 [Vibrio vulnificus]|uniref:hypothetical protein n=1 Tax=Vibrio vulnificus TaxID=672 RepID=UPI001CDB4A29|nr:hypothetical protein [Vibrio vulnificus]MCA3898853.1 hypothetical protein [Vibrio vulnificus]
MNPFFWIVLLFLFYMILPSIFSEEINYYYNWEIDQDSIFYARLLVFNVGFSLSLLLLVFRSSSIYFKPCKMGAKPILLYAIWFVIVLYLFWVAKSLLTGEIFSAAFLYNADAAKDPYKLKNVAYLLLPITTYMFFHTRSYWVFLPSLIIICLDVLHGSRTTAFICIVPFLLCAVVNKKKLYLPQLLFLFVMMIVVGIVRSDNVVQEVPWYINAIGEFRETYITLPLYITDEDYVTSGNFYGYIASLFFGILQPLRGAILEAFTLPGSYIAIDISRGYGLGSNFIIEPLYYGFSGLFISLMLLFFFLIVIYKNISRLELENSLVMMSMFVVFARLIVREGAPVNMGLFFFILLAYVTPVFLMKRVKL